MTVHILAAVAEHEAKMISERIKVALAAAQARGTKLGFRANAKITPGVREAGGRALTARADMALTRGAISGLVDLNRVAVLRTASNFDRPYPGESAWHSLCGCGPEGDSGGFVPAISNLWAASAPYIKDVVAHWDKWEHGVRLSRRAH